MAYFKTLFHIIDDNGNSVSPSGITIKYGLNVSIPSRTVAAETLSTSFSTSSSTIRYNCSVSISDENYEFIRFDAKLYLNADFDGRKKVRASGSSTKNPYGNTNSAFDISSATSTGSSRPDYVEVWIVLKNTSIKTVILDPAGGTVDPSSIQCTIGQPYGHIPIPTKDGFLFVGWYDGDYLITSDSIFSDTSSELLIAHWSDIPPSPSPSRPDKQKDHIIFGVVGMIIFDSSSGSMVYAE